jgi:hypothetical protein
MPLVSQAEYAKMRGCSEAAVSTARKKRIKDADVIQGGKVWIDTNKADVLWARNSRPRRGGNLPQQPAPRPASRPAPERLPTDQELKALIMGLPEDQIPDDLNEITRRKEHYNAERQRVAALRERGEVLPADQVKAEAFALARALRDGLMRVADRMAPTLAATADARQVHHLLTEEIRVALRGLGDA